MFHQHPAGILGIDISHYQSTIDLTRSAQEFGVKFVYAKASESLTEIDPSYTRHRAAAKSAGLPFGAYHFFDHFADPAQQAKRFINTAAPVKNDLIPMLDVENLPPGQQENPAIGHAALACWAEIKALCGHFPILYSGDAFFQERRAAIWPKEATLWIARYGNEPKTTCSIWQYAENGQMPGAAEVDLDVYTGADLEALGIS